MNLPSSEWAVSNGDPLSLSAPSALWYTNNYARFSRVDSNLLFGNNFFPFDASAEEILNGHDYHFGVKWEANVYATTTGSYGFSLTSDDDAWVYVNGTLVGDNSGVHQAKTLNATTTLNVGANKVQIFFAERHTLASFMSFSFNDTNLLIKPYSPVCPNPNTNTPPTITLIGSNPLNISVGTVFVDPGATANDAEDGNLTSSIVKTGTVASTTGSYTITYTVTDSGGLSATTTRVVNVVSPSCTPGLEMLENGSFEDVKVTNIQKWTVFPWYKPGLVWYPTASTSSTFGLEVQAGYTEDTSPWKAYNGDQYAEIDNGSAVKVSNKAFTIPGKKYKLSFAYSPRPHTSSNQNKLEVSLNGIAISNIVADGSNATNTSWILKDIVFNATTTETVIGFMDARGGTDNKVGMFIDGVSLKCVSESDPSPVNTPPTITLIGSNPLNITVNTPFVDPGATANDAEDGNLTSSIIKTGTVNASTTGSYVLTYVVKDSGNLYATTTRTVNVNPVVCTSNCGGGGNTNPSVSISANPGTITVGATSTLSWTSQNVTSCSASWTLSTSTSGSQGVAPISTTDYAITCGGSFGTTTATTTVTVNPVNPPVNPPSGGGGGGGGGGSSIGGRRRDISNLLSPQGEILGATSCSYLRDYLKIDWQNDRVEVLKLQSFLNQFEGENLGLTGTFDQATFDAVARFQTKYSEDILYPWGDRVTKGFVYILTKKKINEIYCNTVLLLSQSDSDEIRAFREFVGTNPDDALISGRSVGVNTNTDLDLGLSDTLKDNSKNSSLVVELKGNNATTSIGAALRNAAISFFGLPEKLSDEGRYVLYVFVLLLALWVLSRFLNKSKTPVVSVTKSTDTKATKDSPVIVLPAKKNDKKEEILPDEEIIIDNGEEEVEEIK